MAALEDQLEQMKNIASKTASEKKREEDTLAILLFGSVVKGNIHLESDLDMVVIKDRKDRWMSASISYESECL